MDKEFHVSRQNKYNPIPQNTSKETRMKIQEIEKLKRERNYVQALNQLSLLLDDITEGVDLSEYPLYFENGFEKLIYWINHPGHVFEEPEEPIHMILFNYGSLLIECNLPDKAKDVLKQAWDLAPYSSIYALEYIESLKFLKENDEAIKSIVKAFEFTIEPNCIAHLFRDLGFILIEKGELYLAAACYINSLNYEKSPTALSELEYIKLSSDGNIEGSPEKIDEYLNSLNISLNPDDKIFQKIDDVIEGIVAAEIEDDELFDLVTYLQERFKEDK